MEPADDEDLDHGARWQGVRDLVRYARATGFDEDPPARIDAILMAAARQHAPDHATKPGAFERVRRWLVGTMLQPAVAGAVAVAVIGGAAGVFYLKGKRSVVEPTIGAESRSAPPDRPENGLGDVPNQPGPTDPATGSATFTTGTESAALEARLSEIEERQDEGERKATERPRDLRPKGGEAAGPGGGGGGGGGGDDGNVLEKSAVKEQPADVDFKPDGRDTTTVVTTGSDRGGGGSAAGAVAVGGVKTQITGRTDPPPPPPPDPVADEEDSGASQRESPPPPSQRAQAENLLKQARTAARKKDCATVKTMAKRARQLDAAYYKDTFSRDAAVKDCL